MSLLVIALGGNALQTQGEATAAAQQRVAHDTARQLLPLIKAGHRLVIVHGNGPQVGNIVLHEESINTTDVPTLPLDSCVAMSQGSIGFWLQNALKNVLNEARIATHVSTIVSQVRVAKNDPAFKKPTKPIGPFYSEKQAKKLETERDFHVTEDAGRGWRRVVPSPKPIELIEMPTLKALIASNIITIVGGGGGIPVIETKDGYAGVEAVIDKDFSAAMIADTLNADKLVILTSVPAVMIHFNTPEQSILHRANTKSVKKYIKEGHFAAGSMLPKVEAAIQFSSRGKHRETIITSLDNVADALDGKNGTIIHSYVA